MKKKNLIIILVVVIVLVVALIAGGIFFLTKDKDTTDEKEKTSQNSDKKEKDNNKDDDESKEAENNSVEEFTSEDDLLNELAKAYNDKNANKLTKYVNLNELKKFVKNIGMDEDLIDDIDNDTIKNAYEYLLDEYNTKYDSDDTSKVEGPNDITEKFGMELYSDEEEYEKELGGYIVYVMSIELDGTSENDLIIIKENKDKYSLVATRLLIAATGEVISNNNSTTTDDDNNNDNDNDDNNDNLSNTMAEQEIKLFNATFELYEGLQSGAMVRTLLSNIITNNSREEDNEITIDYVSGSDDTLEDQTIETAADINELRSGISAGHKYTVSFEKDSDGRINQAIIEY